jgi:hypothetical protein
MDSYKINLDSVTILSVNGRDPENSIKAIEYSCKNINFKKKLILTNKDINHESIEVKNVKGLSNIQEYNLFCIKELHKYVNTDFCLIVQPDGFVVEPRLWSDFYLQYDYIGAPWDLKLSREVLIKCNMHSNNDQLNIVGNGGFSLRSKKLLEECSKLEYTNPFLEEDCMVSALHRKHLKEKGIKYAPLDIAQQFAMESPVNNKSIVGNTFGFHGRHHWFQEYLDIIEK